MDAFWQFIQDHAKEEWTVITGAPLACAILVLITGVLVWLFLKHHYEGRLETRQDRIELLKEQVAQLSQKLLDNPPANISSVPPNIKGKWFRLDGGKVQIEQSNSGVNATLINGDVSHAATGQFSASERKFIVKTTRIDPKLAQGKTTTVIDEEWLPVDEDILIFKTTGTDGKSELPTDYREIGVLFRSRRPISLTLGKQLFSQP